MGRSPALLVGCLVDCLLLVPLQRRNVKQSNRRQCELNIIVHPVQDIAATLRIFTLETACAVFGDSAGSKAMQTAVESASVTWHYRGCYLQRQGCVKPAIGLR